jgi:nucleoside-diphosphate-sugar epimerase
MGRDKSNMKKILILGATGQIGSALLKELLSTKHEIAVLSRVKKNYPDKVRTTIAKEFTSTVYKTALSGIDHVIYCLGIPEQYVTDTKIFHETNYEILKTFLEQICQSGCQNLTYISTYEIFADVNGTMCEANPLADETGMSPYYRSMIRAYKLVEEVSPRCGINLTTIHPVAVYGGLNTGRGITNLIEQLVNRRFLKAPFLFDGRFPVIHVDSLASGIIELLDRQGPFILSDQMTDLSEIAHIVRQYAASYIPVKLPLWMIKAGAATMEAAATLIHTAPILANVQIQYITKGSIPMTEKAQRETKWKPLPIDEGIKKYLLSRPTPDQ